MSDEAPTDNLAGFAYYWLWMIKDRTKEDSYRLLRSTPGLPDVELGVNSIEKTVKSLMSARKDQLRDLLDGWERLETGLTPEVARIIFNEICAGSRTVADFETRNFSKKNDANKDKPRNHFPPNVSGNPLMVKKSLKEFDAEGSLPTTGKIYSLQSEEFYKAADQFLEMIFGDANIFHQIIKENSVNEYMPATVPPMPYHPMGSLQKQTEDFQNLPQAKEIMASAYNQPPPQPPVNYVSPPPPPTPQMTYPYGYPPIHPQFGPVMMQQMPNIPYAAQGYQQGYDTSMQYQQYQQQNQQQQNQQQPNQQQPNQQQSLAQQNQQQDIPQQNQQQDISQQNQQQEIPQQNQQQQDFPQQNFPQQNLPQQNQEHQQQQYQLQNQQQLLSQQQFFQHQYFQQHYYQQPYYQPQQIQYQQQYQPPQYQPQQQQQQRAYSGNNRGNNQWKQRQRNNGYQNEKFSRVQNGYNNAATSSSSSSVVAQKAQSASSSEGAQPPIAQNETMEEAFPKLNGVETTTSLKVEVPAPDTVASTGTATAVLTTPRKFSDVVSHTASTPAATTSIPPTSTVKKDTAATSATNSAVKNDAAPVGSQVKVSVAAPVAAHGPAPAAALAAVPVAVPAAAPKAAPAAAHAVAPIAVPAAAPKATPVAAHGPVAAAAPAAAPVAVPASAPAAARVNDLVAAPTAAPVAATAAVSAATPTAVPVAVPAAVPVAATAAVSAATPTAAPVVAPVAAAVPADTKAKESPQALKESSPATPETVSETSKSAAATSECARSTSDSPSTTDSSQAAELDSKRTSKESNALPATSELVVDTSEHQAPGASLPTPHRTIAEVVQQSISSTPSPIAARVNGTASNQQSPAVKPNNAAASPATNGQQSTQNGQKESSSRNKNRTDNRKKSMESQHRPSVSYAQMLYPQSKKDEKNIPVASSSHVSQSSSATKSNSATKSASAPTSASTPTDWHTVKLKKAAESTVVSPALTDCTSPRPSAPKKQPKAAPEPVESEEDDVALEDPEAEKKRQKRRRQRQKLKEDNRQKKQHEKELARQESLARVELMNGKSRENGDIKENGDTYGTTPAVPPPPAFDRNNLAARRKKRLELQKKSEMASSAASSNNGNSESLASQIPNVPMIPTGMGSNPMGASIAGGQTAMSAYGVSNLPHQFRGHNSPFAVNRDGVQTLPLFLPPQEGLRTNNKEGRPMTYMLEPGAEVSPMFIPVLARQLEPEAPPPVKTEMDENAMMIEKLLIFDAKDKIQCLDIPEVERTIIKIGMDDIKKMYTRVEKAGQLISYRTGSSKISDETEAKILNMMIKLLNNRVDLCEADEFLVNQIGNKVAHCSQSFNYTNYITALVDFAQERADSLPDGTLRNNYEQSVVLTRVYLKRTRTLYESISKYFDFSKLDDLEN